MAARLCRKSVFLWTFRAAHGQVGCGHSPVYVLRDKRPNVCLLRNLCLRHDQNSEHLAERQLVGRGEMLSSLLDMGFTETEVEEIARNSPTGHTVTQHLSVLSALLALDFNPSTILKILDNCPELYRVKGDLMQQRVNNLRKLGLVEGSLQRVVKHYPQLLTLPMKRVNGMCRFLREKCLLTAQQITAVLRDSPAIVLEDPDRLEYKFQYAYFRMGLRQAEMVKSGLFRVSLEEVRCRHGFLEKRGLYQTPDKKGQTRIVNPKLKDFLSVPEDTFLSKVAVATGEEFEVFRKLMEREMQEEEEPEFSGSDEEDGEGYESEDGGSASYNKRRKK